MTPREFMFLTFGIAIAGLLHSRRDQQAKNAEKAERPKGLSREFVIRAISIMALVNAVFFGALSLFGLFGAVLMLLGKAEWEPILFLMVPSFAALSAFLAWLGLRLGEEWSLLDRCVRAVYAGIAAFRSHPLEFDKSGSSKPPLHDLA